MSAQTLPERHPDWINPEADLDGCNGNAFAVMGFVSHELKRAGNSAAVVDAYCTEAMSGDYDHLLRVSMLYGGQFGA